MANVVQGVVERITQRGRATNICVAGTWYGCGFNGVPCQEGDEVTFSVTQNGNFLNADVNSMEVLSSGNQAPPRQQQQRGGYQQRRSAPRASSGGAPAGNPKDDYWKQREERDVETQRRIQYQASRNSAIAAVAAALEKDILPLPATKAKAFDAYLAMIDELTERYNNATSGEAQNGPVPADDDDLAF